MGTLVPNRTNQKMIQQANALRAADLKKQFGVYGHFYRTLLAGQEHACRSVLTLIAHDHTPSTLQDLEQKEPDLLVVMMNPGSSRPLDKTYEIPFVEDPTTGLEQRNWVATQPDNTQYQIMRVMAAMSYQHARVMNISDLRETKSPRLIALVKDLAEQPGGGMHALFAPGRSKECQGLMGTDRSTPVLVGWGRHKGLLPLVQQAMQTLQGRPMVGVPVEGQPMLFAHPSPMLQKMKEAWLSQIVQRLREL
ncbi:hypothetical protein [Magnetococcus sp. PR-3]|uniref:hypothetical protein n=1 Tax=Magnetococcus sp. PR-3 TaxID=3120355 RepID=UPI002FCE5D90